MARLVPHTATGPAEIKPSEKSTWICMCGLSQNLPLCDGAHKLARQNEPAGKLCIYDTSRTKIIETRDQA